MKGKIAVSVKNRHISFKLNLERNITIITGDSGTGKTKLINMVRAYSEEGKSSGVTLKCDKQCLVLDTIIAVFAHMSKRILSLQLLSERLPVA